MLIAHPTSSCDVCLERYAWDAPASDSEVARPHVIGCGHVFCHRCLQNLRVPRTCPLCRAAFHLTRAIRVHVDLASEDSPLVLSRDEVEAQRLSSKLYETAACSSTIDPMVDIPPACVEVMQEAQLWLANVAPESHMNLKFTLALLARSKALSDGLQTALEEATRIREEKEKFRRHLKRTERTREQEQLLSQNQEKTWAIRVAEIERECERKITEATTERQHLEDELARYKQTLEAAQEASAEVIAQAHHQLTNQRSLEAKRHSLAMPSTARSAPEPSSPRFVERSTIDTHLPVKTRSESFARATTASPELAQAAHPDYQYTYNPLPRPPEPVPLGRLPAFARPRPGSRAYEAARSLARHRTTHGRSKDKDKEKGSGKENTREKEGSSSKGKSRERSRLRGADSSASKDRRRETPKDGDKGTDTSATETQERQRVRERKTSLTTRPPQSGVADQKEHSQPSAEASSLLNQAEGKHHLPRPPRSVVGGWGLEKNWRTSIGSDDSGASGSHDDLVQALFDPPGGAGSSHTRIEEIELGKEKGKGRQIEPNTGLKESLLAYDMVGTSSAPNQTSDQLAWPSQNHDDFHQHNPSPFPSNPAPASRDRRNTLGLVLIPSPDGQGGYKYEYQYRYIDSQSPPHSGTDTVTPVANGVASASTYLPNYQTYPSYPQYAPADKSSSSKSAALPRRVTDSHVHSQAQVAQQTGGMSSLIKPIPRPAGVPSSTALYVPQPRRISLTIPDPEAGPSPQHRSETHTSHLQSERQPLPFPSVHHSGSHTSFHGQAASYDDRPRVSPLSLYKNTNPSASMSLDSALASLAQGSSHQYQTLKHKSSDTSTSSASTGISLTGTSSERRKQLLDTLFTEKAGQPDQPAASGSGLRPTVQADYQADRNHADKTPKTVTLASGNANGDGGTARRREATTPGGIPSRDGRLSRGLSGSTRPPSQTFPPSHARPHPASYASPTSAPFPTQSQQERVVRDGSNAVQDVYAVYTAYRQHMHALSQVHPNAH